MPLLGNICILDAYHHLKGYISECEQDVVNMDKGNTNNQGKLHGIFGPKSNDLIS